ncbi:MAG TPA: hypothetical protein VNT25_02375 [Allosphingosinicella sp.]|nr:hypothetical protein [Allosphingosinicella sp.]
MFRKAILAAGLICAAPAHAEWHQATSTHFIMYSDGSPEEVREAAAKLEKFDTIIRARARTNKPHSPVKLRVYLLRSMSAVEAIAGPGVGGFYMANERGPFLVGARRGPEMRYTQRTLVDRSPSWGPHVLQHEYAHHFMLQYFPVAYPPWLVEGFAEYFGMLDFVDENVIELGHAPLFRVDTMREDWVPIDELLTAQTYEDMREHGAAIYAEGWLLLHYADNHPQRAKQLQQYINRVASGLPYKQAAEEAFGSDLKTLDQELRAYLRQGIKALRLSLKPIEVGPIDVRPLTPGEEALLRTEILASAGLPVVEAKQLVGNVREKARQFPNDKAVLRLLTEVERAAENDAEATEAVKRWLSVAPQDPKALMHQAELQVRKLVNEKSTDRAAWDAARALILKANKIAPQDPEILVSYYDSFQAAGELPPPGAQAALMRAHNLVPQDDRLRQRVAMDFEARGMIEDAIFVITPAANSPHSRKEDDPKRRAERERWWKKYRMAGEAYMETPREMLKRLQQKLVAGKTASAASPVS